MTPNDIYFLIFAMVIPLSILTFIHFKVRSAFKKPEIKKSSLFEKLKQHEAEVLKPTLKTKLKKLIFKVMPYVTGLILKFSKRLIDVTIFYLLFKLFNL